MEQNREYKRVLNTQNMQGTTCRTGQKFLNLFSCVLYFSHKEIYIIINPKIVFLRTQITQEATYFQP